MAAMRQCLQRLAGRDDLRASVTEQVRNAVRARLPDGCPPIETIAAELRLPVGAIQRHLHFDGMSYNGLVETVRRDLALLYLKQRQFSFSEISCLLGYSELSAFSRAVRRWTGESPRNLRSQLIQDQAR